jgi:hypothetical protein
MTSLEPGAAPRVGCLYRLLRAVAIAFGLAALATLAGYIAMHRVMEEDRMEVPRVIGLDSVAAEALVKEAGLTPRVVAEESPRGALPARGRRAGRASRSEARCDSSSAAGPPNLLRPTWPG